ncbi:MAG: DUF202 domain-containing protein [Gammaproteobacteria bacterium]
MTEDRDSRQIALLQFLVEQSYLRSEWSAARSYLNAERNLLLLIHAALALMVFGIAIDRFGLLVHRLPWPTVHGLLHTPSWESVTLILLGALTTLFGGVRYLPFIFAYRRNRHMPLRFGAYLPSVFAFLLTVYGTVLLALLLVR